MSMSKSKIEEEVSRPRAIQHHHILPDGRYLSYYTYKATQEAPNETENYHPLIYFDGYLHGSGQYSGGPYWASLAAKHSLDFHLLVRPGFGYSHPLSKEEMKSPDAYIQGFVRDVWNFVSCKKWKSFSVVGASGGGPFTLAFLESYLKALDESNAVAKLETVAIVAGICCSGGVEGMEGGSKIAYNIASKTGGVMGWFWHYIYRLLLKTIRDSTAKGKNRKDVENVRMAFFQGIDAADVEGRALFRGKQGYEEDLRKRWAARVSSSKSTDLFLPLVSIFNGYRDVDTPPGGAQFVHESLLGSAANLHIYPDLDHESILAKKGDEIMESLVPQE